MTQGQELTKLLKELQDKIKSGEIRIGPIDEIIDKASLEKHLIYTLKRIDFNSLIPHIKLLLGVDVFPIKDDDSKVRIIKC